MSNEELICQWKNPEQRGEVNHPSGVSFNELSFEEMFAVNGGAQVKVTPATPLIPALTLPTAAKCVSAVASAVASASLSAISGIVTANKKCLG